MAAPQEKLAESLEALRALQDRGVVAIRAADIKRVHRERLLKNGFLQEVLKGWYIAVRPHEAAGESTAWYACFWAFCVAYLRERFGSDWCLSPEQSWFCMPGTRPYRPSLWCVLPRAATRPRHCRIVHRCSMFAPPFGRGGYRREGRATAILATRSVIASSPGFFEKNPH